MYVTPRSNTVFRASCLPAPTMLSKHWNSSWLPLAIHLEGQKSVRIYPHIRSLLMGFRRRLERSRARLLWPRNDCNRLLRCESVHLVRLHRKIRNGETFGSALRTFGTCCDVVLKHSFLVSKLCMAYPRSLRLPMTCLIPAKFFLGDPAGALTLEFATLRLQPLRRTFCYESRRYRIGF